MQMKARRRLSIGCVFTYVAEIPTPAVFMVRPAIARGISTDGDEWLTEPPAQIHGYTDIYGNECVRTMLPVGRSQFGFSAVADVPDATEDVDFDAFGNLVDGQAARIKPQHLQLALAQRLGGSAPPIHIEHVHDFLYGWRVVGSARCSRMDGGNQMADRIGFADKTTDALVA